MEPLGTLKSPGVPQLCETLWEVYASHKNADGFLYVRRLHVSARPLFQGRTQQLEHGHNSIGSSLSATMDSQVPATMPYTFSEPSFQNGSLGLQV